MGIPFYNSRNAVLIIAWLAIRQFVIMVLILAGIYGALVAAESVSESIDYWAPMGGPSCNDGRCGRVR